MAATVWENLRSLKSEPEMEARDAGNGGGSTLSSKQNSEVYTRYLFNTRSQEAGETIDDFVSALRTLASCCNFQHLREGLIRDRVVVGVRSQATRESLLRQPELSLHSALHICKQAEEQQQTRTKLTGTQTQSHTETGFVSTAAAEEAGDEDAFAGRWALHSSETRAFHGTDHVPGTGIQDWPALKQEAMEEDCLSLAVSRQSVAQGTLGPTPHQPHPQPCPQSDNWCLPTRPETRPITGKAEQGELDQTGETEQKEPVQTGQAVLKEPVQTGEAVQKEPVQTGQAVLKEPVQTGPAEQKEPVQTGRGPARRRSQAGRVGVVSRRCQEKHACSCCGQEFLYKSWLRKHQTACLLSGSSTRPHGNPSTPLSQACPDPPLSQTCPNPPLSQTCPNPPLSKTCQQPSLTAKDCSGRRFSRRQRAMERPDNSSVQKDPALGRFKTLPLGHQGTDSSGKEEDTYAVCDAGTGDRNRSGDSATETAGHGAGERKSCSFCGRSLASRRGLLRHQSRCPALRRRDAGSTELPGTMSPAPADSALSLPLPPTSSQQPGTGEELQSGDGSMEDGDAEEEGDHGNTDSSDGSMEDGIGTVQGSDGDLTGAWALTVDGPCHVCGRKFRYRSSLAKHLMQHRGQHQLSCPTCGKAFPSPTQLQRHLLSHSQYRPFACEFCGKTFKTMTVLMYHRLSHTGEKSCQCEVCGRQFFQKAYLKKHMRLHTGERPYQCRLCGKRYHVNSGLYSHMFTHSDQRPHVCEVCGKGFPRHYSLKNHLKVHSELRPFVCTVCQKAFKTRSELRRHELIHKGDKCFICHICGAGFIRSSHLWQHVRHHHPQGAAKQLPEPKDAASGQKEDACSSSSAVSTGVPTTASPSPLCPSSPSPSSPSPSPLCPSPSSPCLSGVNS